MNFAAIETALPGVLILEPKIHGDDRGFFFESFNAKAFLALTGVAEPFVQDNHSLSRRGVLRGMHYQIRHAQGKLVRVAAGEIFDAVIDLRRSSPSFSRWLGVRISADNRRQLWVPPGFAHGFLVLSETAELLYKTTDYWHPEHERSIAWNDPAVGIAWPTASTGPILAAKDAAASSLADAEVFA